MDSLKHDNSEGFLNPSSHLLTPSDNLTFPNPITSHSLMNSSLPDLIEQHAQQKNTGNAKTGEEITSFTDTTTLADSKQLVSQTGSQIGNICPDNYQSPQSNRKVASGEKGDNGYFVNSSTSIEDIRKSPQEKNLEDDGHNKGEINGGENFQQKNNPEGSNSAMEQGNKIEPEVQVSIEKPNNDEMKEVQIFKETKEGDSTLPSKIKKDKHDSARIDEGQDKSNNDAPTGEEVLENKHQQIPLLPLEGRNSVNRSETSEKQFTSDQQDSEGYYSNIKTRESLKDISAPSSGAEEGKEKEAAKNQLAKKPKISLADFQKITLLGRGSYAEVHLVKRTLNPNKLYALKVIDKYFMKKEKKEHQVYIEKEVLMRSNHPNIVKFYSSFQDKKKLYFVLEYVGGGEFSNYLSIQRVLTKEQIIFFSAEIINILEYLHSNGIVHRDLKPENILLTNEGHLKCIDFGTARFLNGEKKASDMFPSKKPEEVEEEHANDETRQRSDSRTFVGTAQYVSPEMLENSECSTPGDLWALGCMIYQMALGRYPFEGVTEYVIFEKIRNFEITFPEEMDTDVKDLVQKLIVMNPQDRLGAGPSGSNNDYAALKSHPLFKGVDFSVIHKQKAPLVDIVSPYKQKNQAFSTFEDLAQKHMPTRKHFLSDDLQTLEKESSGQKSSREELSEEGVNVTSKVTYQEELSGLVSKKCGWVFFRPRLLVLSNIPTLSYFDPDTRQIKGEIPLEETTTAKLESNTSWVINTQKKKYYFKEIEPESSERWVKAINMMVDRIRQTSQNKQ